MRHASRILAALGLVLAGVAIALWPIHGNGVHGSALRPRYGSFGWFAYAPLPEHPSPAQLREAGVRLPAASWRRVAAGQPASARPGWGRQSRECWLPGAEQRPD